MQKALICIAILHFLLSSCSQKIVHFTNDRSSFSKYKTFVVVNLKVSEENLSDEGEAVMNLIVRNIKNEMIRRDYVAASENPDLVIRYELIANQRTEVSIDPYSIYYYPGQFYRSRTFLESALLIEINDASTNKLVWQASVDLNKYNKRDGNQEILQKAVTQLFNTYLYRAGSNTSDPSLIVE